MHTSVALCAYNGQKYLTEQIESILDQSVPVDEIIICDDKSSDATIEIIEGFISRGAPIKLYKNPVNLGFTKNFEKAIGLCSGDIIFLADQDDIWYRDKVGMILDYFERHPDKEYVFTNGILINEWGLDSYGRSIFDIVGITGKNKKLFDQGHFYDVLGVTGKILGATTALRASFLPYCLPFPQMGKYAIHDGIITATAVIWNKIAYIDQCLIKYRIHGNQTVGLNYRFKFLSQSYELADDVLMWHEGLVETYRPQDMAQLRIFYKRFWTLHSRFSFFKLLSMYLHGDYKTYYKDYHRVFFRDVRGVFIRLNHRAKERIRKICNQ